MNIIEYIKSEASYFYNIYEEALLKKSKIDVILYGAGEKARLFLSDYDNINVKFCCDDSTDKIGKYINNIPIISIDELQEYNSNLPIIITSKWSDDISKRLKLLGFKHVYHRFSLEYLMHLYELQEVYNQLEDDLSKNTFLGLIKYVFNQNSNVFETITFGENQYFLEDIFNFGVNEIIVDGGAFIGDTLNSYIEQSKGDFSKYYCFEPDNINFNLLKEYIEKLEFKDKIDAYQYGLFSSEKIVRFSNLNSSASCINEFSDSFINVINIDKVCKGDDITMIKMDIEGSEYEALTGSRNTILRTKPKLAICVYHLASDLWKIPILIKSFDKNYKFYLRHHNKKCWYETVLYATL